jgi:hypothetical protein
MCVHRVHRAHRLKHVFQLRGARIGMRTHSSMDTWWWHISLSCYSFALLPAAASWACRLKPPRRNLLLPETFLPEAFLPDGHPPRCAYVCVSLLVPQSLLSLVHTHNTYNTYNTHTLTHSHTHTHTHTHTHSHTHKHVLLDFKQQRERTEKRRGERERDRGERK